MTSKPDEKPVKPNLDEVMDQVVKLGIEGIKRYGGNPELLLKEHPHRDFRKPPQSKTPQK